MDRTPADASPQQATTGLCFAAEDCVHDTESEWHVESVPADCGRASLLPPVGEGALRPCGS